MRSLYEIGDALLNVRYALDPLDDAFRALNRRDKALPVFDEEFISHCLHECRVVEKELAAFTEDDMSIDFFIIRQQVEETILKLQMRLWGTFLVGYDHSPLGRITGLIPELKVENDADTVYLLKVLSSVEGYLDSCGNELIRAYSNKRPPLASNVASAIQRWSNIIENNGDELLPAGLDEALRLACNKVFTVSIQPAINRYINVLHSIMSNSREDTEPGLCYIANGKQQYIELVRFNTDNFAPPDEIHRHGMQEVEKIQRKIIALSANDPASTDDVFSPAMLMKNSDDEVYLSEGAFFEDFYDILQHIEVMFGDVFDFKGILALNIKKIPSHLADSSPTAYYVPGTDNSHPGTLFVNPGSMIGQAIGSADAMIYHESLPGHHAQFELARKLSIPDYRKTAWFNCFIEGWALYVEDLAEELGLYTKPEQLKGKLAQELFRAARLVVDTGIHFYGWSKSESIAWLRRNTGLTLTQSEREINRYIEYPAQALSYATGKYHIQALRQRCRAIDNHFFDYKKFHHNVLKHGVAPIYAIENSVINELYATH